MKKKFQPINCRDIRKIRKDLIRELKQISEEITEQTEALQSLYIKSRNGGQDLFKSVTEVNAQQDIYFRLSILVNEQRVIVRALERINNNTFGKCAVDGEYIPRSRVLAAPTSPFCLKHQKMLEDQKK